MVLAVAAVVVSVVVGIYLGSRVFGVCGVGSLLDLMIAYILRIWQVSKCCGAGGNARIHAGSPRFVARFM